MEFHELANIFPMLGEAELEELRADIEKNGLAEEITLYEGKVLDGRNRATACLMLGIKPRCVEYKGNDPLAFVVSKNLKRRHLNESQRAMVAAKIADIKKELHDKEKAQKKKWIMEARSKFNPGKKESCVICGKYRSVCEAHHTKPLHVQYGSGYATHQYVWLCPTHHAGVHQLLDKKLSAWPSWDGFDEEEKEAMTDIAAMSLKQ